MSSQGVRRIDALVMTPSWTVQEPLKSAVEPCRLRPEDVPGYAGRLGREAHLLAGRTVTGGAGGPIRHRTGWS